MKSPNLISSLAMHNLMHSQTIVNGKWQPARPMGYSSFKHRLKCSYLVFIGKADALIWPNQ